MSYGEVLRVGGFEALVGAERADQRVEVASSVDVMLLKFCVQVVAAHAVLFLVDEDGKVGVIVTHALDVLQKTDAGDVLEGFAVLLGGGLALRDSVVHLLQIQKAVGGSDLVHLAVDARGDDRCFACKAEVLEIVDTLFGRFVMTDEGAAFDRVVDLGGVETERTHVAGFQNGFTVLLDAEGMGGVVDNF